MKKTALVLFLLSFLHYQNLSQNFWAYTAGSIKEDEVMDICYDNAGNIISTGYFSGSTQFAAGITLNTASYGIPDIYVSKSTVAGQVLWASKAGGTGTDRANAVKCDATGNVFITGYYYGTATFGSITLTSASGSQDGFIAKLDANGNFLWAKSFGGNLAEWGNAISVDELGNPLITGQFQGSSTFGGTTLTSVLNPSTAFSSFDAFIAKYDTNGNLVWVKQGSGKYDDRGLDIITDHLNNVYVCGQFSDTIQFQNTYSNAIMNATFIIKYNAAGQEQWFRKAAGVFSIPYSMVMDNAHNIYITGDFQGTLTYFGSSGNSFVNGVYGNKAFLMKIDNNGNFIWGKSEASTNYVSGKKVALDAQQDPYIFGEFGCTMNEYSDAYGPGIFNSIGFGDLFITKYNAAGTRQWFRQYGGPRNDKAHGLLVAGINEPVMAGSYEDRLNIPTTLYSLTGINNSSAQTTANQPYNYCGSANNYADYSVLYCNGYSDAFIYKGIDLTRKPYDYYSRSGTLCDLSFVKSCIDNNLTNCPDTIKLCANGTIHANSNTNDYYIGPIQRYIWNSNLNDTLNALYVNTSGYKNVKVTTLDGCYSSRDTVYVKINPLPPTPVITDSYGANTLQPPSTHPIHICGPSTITLTGGNVQNTTYYWTGNYTSTHDSVAVINASGTYTFIVTDHNSCSNRNSISVQIDAPVASFGPKQKNDTITICQGQNDKHIVCDSISNPSLNYTYGCLNYQGQFMVSQSPGLTINPLYSGCDLSFAVSANATGNYTYTAAYIINNLCVHDTIYFTGHIYIVVKPKPDALITVSGNTLLCPGDSSLLTVTIGSFSSSNITYTISPNDSVTVYTQGWNYISAYLKDTISGCSKTITNSIYVTIKPNPFIILNPYNSVICPNDSVHLTINLAGATNYEWHGPMGLIPGNNQSIYMHTAGFYHCIVTDNTGCVFTTNTVELKQYATPYLISTPTNIICNNQPVTLNVITLDATQIVWNAPLSGSGAVKTITNPGVYSCQVTMCGITTSLSINIIGSNPLANITTFGSTTACPFDSILLTGNAGMSNYVWQPGNHLGQNYMVHSAGSYTLEVTDNYGCMATSAPVSVSFTSSVSPPVSVINDTICAGQTATISALSSGTNQIEWFASPNSGPAIGTGTYYITPTLTTQTTYYATSVSASGCHSSGVPATVFMYQTSLAPVLVCDTTVCRHDSLKIMAPQIAGATYNWSGPGIASNNTNSVLIANADSNNAGTYSLQITGFGCSSPSSSVTIYVLDPFPPSISANDSICENTSYSLVASHTNSNVIYEWQGPNNYSSTGDSLNISNAALNQSGTYTITSNEFGCLSSPVTIQLTVIQIPPTPTISSNSPVCTGDTIFLSTQNNPGYVYNWYGSNGVTANGSSVYFVAIDSSYSGYYGVVSSNLFCPGNGSYDTVLVIPYPVMATTADTIGCDDAAITLNCLSNYQNYNWSTGATGPSINVTQSGTYWVTSQNGNCARTDSIHVSLVPCSNFEINVFTPNGDGANDVFMFKSAAIKQVHCEIRDRWGAKMAEFDGPENGWNGKNMSNNKVCLEGTYFYIAEIQTIEGLMKTINGFVQLIR